MNLMQDPLALEAAAPAVQTGHDDAGRADQHRVPADREAVTHCLATWGAVAVKGQNMAINIAKDAQRRIWILT